MVADFSARLNSILQIKEFRDNRRSLAAGYARLGRTQK
jgi:hypothetical protein